MRRGHPMWGGEGERERRDMRSGSKPPARTRTYLGAALSVRRMRGGSGPPLPLPPFPRHACARGADAGTVCRRACVLAACAVCAPAQTWRPAEGRRRACVRRCSPLPLWARRLRRQRLYLSVCVWGKVCAKLEAESPRAPSVRVRALAARSSPGTPPHGRTNPNPNRGRSRSRTRTHATRGRCQRRPAQASCGLGRGLTPSLR